MWNKVAMNPDHEFALVVLTKGADWVSLAVISTCKLVVLRVTVTVYFPQFCSFSKDPSLVCRAINQLQATDENYETFGSYNVHVH